MSTAPFPSRWTPEHPDRLQLYSLATPNGQKVGIMLEETGLPYEAHRIDIMAGDQHDPEFVRINPNAKIPAIIDPDGPGGAPLRLMESGAILLYLAEKTGRFLPEAPAARWETVSWVFFQMASVGPMFGQFGHFYKFARDKTSDDYARERYTSEAARLLGVLDARLGEHDYLAGDAFTVADIATLPWVRGLSFYGGEEAVGYGERAHVQRWVERCAKRPGVQRGVEVCGFGG